MGVGVNLADRRRVAEAVREAIFKIMDTEDAMWGRGRSYRVAIRALDINKLLAEMEER